MFHQFGQIEKLLNTYFITFTILLILKTKNQDFKIALNTFLDFNENYKLCIKISV